MQEPLEPLAYNPIMCRYKSIPTRTHGLIAQLKSKICWFEMLVSQLCTENFALKKWEGSSLAACHLLLLQSPAMALFFELGPQNCHVLDISIQGGAP